MSGHTHVVMFSSGAGSWAAAKRVAQRHGTDDLVLLFCDVAGGDPGEHDGEDSDNYRFLHEAAVNVGGHLVIVNEGRSVWDVFADERMIGNSRVAPCSKRLKQIPARKWVEANCDPATTTIHVGIAPPRLYEMGFAHANCGGFCVRAGHGHFKTLLEVMPERYAYHERKEAEFRERSGKDVSILKDRRGGQVRPLTLTALRQRVQGGGEVDEYDIGGCGCFTGEDLGEAV